MGRSLAQLTAPQQGVVLAKEAFASLQIGS